MRISLKLLQRLLALSTTLLSLSGCISPESPVPKSSTLGPDRIADLIPLRVKDRTGWAADVAAAIEATGKDITLERVCAVLATIEQESGYQVDPVVADLPLIVRNGLKEKLIGLGPLADSAVDTMLSGRVPGSEQTFAQRVARLRTEQDLDRLFRDIALAYQEKMPGTFAMASALSALLGRGHLRDLNPVTTAGSMQVKVSFAKQLAENKGLTDSNVREKLYTRAGGVRAGTARLLAYEASYDDIIYRFADYNAGIYASRNAAFQAQLSDLTEMKLTLDGDLLSYTKDGELAEQPSQSLEAMLRFARSQKLVEWFVERDARKEKSAEFESTTIWDEVKNQWRQKKNTRAPYARVPELRISSPKLRRDRSTSWFAESVKRRYADCRQRSGS